MESFKTFLNCVLINIYFYNNIDDDIGVDIIGKPTLA